MLEGALLIIGKIFEYGCVIPASEVAHDFLHCSSVDILEIQKSVPRAFTNGIGLTELIRNAAAAAYLVSGAIVSKLWVSRMKLRS